jgi:hypothetical protein
MSHSISSLLTRNLHDVFGENDPARRRAAIEEIFTDDCVFYDPTSGAHHGRDEIDRIAGAIKATHPDFQYQPIAQPEEIGQWRAGPMGIGSPRRAACLRRDGFHHCPGWPDCGPLSLFRPAALNCRATHGHSNELRRAAGRAAEALARARNSSLTKGTTP